MNDSDAAPQECSSLPEIVAAFDGRTMDQLVTSLEAIADDDVQLVDVDETGFDIRIQNVGARIEYPTTDIEIVDTINDLLQALSDTWEAAEAELDSE
jgi:hypothetical protein